MLGPWASMLALSIALLIQALLFGDGGITTSASELFQHGDCGLLVAYVVYRLVAGGPPFGRQDEHSQPPWPVTRPSMLQLLLPHVD